MKNLIDHLLEDLSKVESLINKSQIILLEVKPYDKAVLSSAIRHNYCHLKASELAIGQAIDKEA